MIQEFLTNNLIQITEDENVEKLLKASVALEKKISKDKSKIPIFTLIALDPEIKVTDPNVQEVQELIIDKWKTFTANCKDTPLTYIRAVILETLEKLSSDINIANIVFLSSRNITKHLNLKGKEKELIIQFLTDLGYSIETKAAEDWSLLPSSSSNTKETELSKLPNISLDTETLQKKLEDASGPHNTSGTPNYESPNPHWPNAAQPWSYQFAPRATNGIAEVVNLALKKQSAVINENTSKIQEVLIGVQTQTREISMRRNDILQMRSQLLWWKESCYSNTLKYSYRDAQNGLLQLILALDYSLFMPFIYPQSADYFLKETHRGIISGEDKKIKLSEIFKFIDSSKETLKPLLSDEPFGIERISLTQFVKGFVFGKYSIKLLKDTVGISENTELTLSEFTLWLFHDLQVLNSYKK